MTARWLLQWKRGSGEAYGEQLSLKFDNWCEISFLINQQLTRRKNVWFEVFLTETA